MAEGLARITHPLPPLFDGRSRVLVLGTMPSPKSREAGFYYAHPQNRFWRLLSQLLESPLPTDNAGRRQLALSHHIALWDVLESCDIRGAADDSIKNPRPNDLGVVLSRAPIAAIFTTGATAARLYRRLQEQKTGMPAIPLPSTSPANCRHYTYADLLAAYRKLLPYLGPAAQGL